MINRELAAEVKSLMPSRERETDRNSPVSMWNEMDRLRGKPGANNSSDIQDKRLFMVRFQLMLNVWLFQRRKHKCRDGKPKGPN